ncbi:O-antigen polysaccharide polymerase Wzy [Pseudomonas neustonica]|uniref:O-antigen polysaccharide polymerase Wzy n=1 Tax=Pseudomonas neustonica TaxID=2487346 RepID=UPI003F46397B
MVTVSRSVFALFMFLSFSLLLMWAFSSDDIYGVAAVLALNVSVFFWSKGDVLHPCTWCPPFITLYNLSIVIIGYFNVRVVGNYPELILINFLAVFFFWLAFVFFGGASKVDQVYSFPALNSLTRGSLRFLCAVSLLLSIAVVLAFFLVGATAKIDFYGGFNSVFRIFLFYLTCLMVGRWAGGRDFVFLLFAWLPFFLFSALSLGERDIFFSFCLVSIMLMYASGKRRRLVYYVVGLAFLMLIPILGEYKNYFSRVAFQKIDYSNYLMTFLDGEFRSAGFNNDVILTSWDGSFFYGVSILKDLVRAVVPGFVMNVENSVGWYNTTFHPEIVAIGRGYGFSLAAEGYVNFGYLGVAIWFLVFGFLSSILYVKARDGIYFFSIYICSIPVFIYAIRGDFSTLLSPILKTMVLPCVFLFVLVVFFKLLAPNRLNRTRP